MPTYSHTENVKAPFQLIWDILLYKACDPRNFVPGVTEVQILEDDRANNRVVRKIFGTNPMGGQMIVVENVTWDEAERIFTFTLVEHPSHTGAITNQVDTVGEGEYSLTYKMDWKFKGEGEDPLTAIHVKPAVIKTVQII